MSTSIHWCIRDFYGTHLQPGGRWDVLTILMTHTNIRLRCWPSIDILVKETGRSRSTVIDAKTWLLIHGAIQLVPYKHRRDEEAKLPPRQHLYQITGQILIEGEYQPYLHMNPEAKAEIIASLSNSSPSESSPSEPKGIDSIEGIPNIKDISATKSRKRTEPEFPKEWHDAIWDTLQVNIHGGNASRGQIARIKQGLIAEMKVSCPDHLATLNVDLPKMYASYKPEDPTFSKPTVPGTIVTFLNVWRNRKPELSLPGMSRGHMIEKEIMPGVFKNEWVSDE